MVLFTKVSVASNGRLFYSCTKHFKYEQNIKALSTSTISSSNQLDKLKSLVGLKTNPIDIALKDKIPIDSDYEIIYNAKKHANYILLGNCASIFTVAVFAGALALKSYDQFSLPNIETSNDNFLQFEESFETNVALSGCFILNLGMLYGVHNTPLRIYYSKEKDDFIIIFQRIFLPWLRYSIPCKPGSVKLIGLSQITIFLGQYKLRRKRLYLFDYYFRFPAYYNMLLGYV